MQDRPDKPEGHDDIEASKAPLMDHLIELRQRLIYALMGIGVGFVVCFAFATQIYNLLVWPYQVARGEGQKIETLESFDTGEKGVPHAFHQHDGLMCGYCTPGFVTACKALLDKNPNPSLDEVKRGLDGNICRCGTYVGVLEAALAAAKAMKGA